HGAVNDLLHGADGQWSQLSKFFQAWSMSVDRCDIEVRAELLLCFFFSVGDEDLPAEADDGLVRAAMAIGFEAATVHANHLRDVFFIPEDIVVEVAIAIKCCLLCNLWRANRAMPDKRWDIIERERRGGISLQRGAEFTFPRNILLAPQAAQQVIIFNRQRDSLADVLAKPWVNRTGVAAAHHQIHASAGQVLQEGEVFGDFQWVIGGNQRSRRRQDEIFCLRCDITQVRGGRGWHKRWVVMLA